MLQINAEYSNREDGRFSNTVIGPRNTKAGIIHFVAKSPCTLEQQPIGLTASWSSYLYAVILGAPWSKLQYMTAAWPQLILLLSAYNSIRIF